MTTTETKSLQAEILDALAVNEHTVASLQAIVHYSETTVRKALARLIESGDVVKNGKAFALALKPEAKPAKAAKPAAEKATAAAPKINTTIVPVKKGCKGAVKPHAVDRDEAVAAYLQSLIGAETPIFPSCDEIAEAMGIESSLVYISLWRLNKTARAYRVRTGDRARRWTASAYLASKVEA